MSNDLERVLEEAERLCDPQLAWGYHNGSVQQAKPIMTALVAVARAGIQERETIGETMRRLGRMGISMEELKGAADKFDAALRALTETNQPSGSDR